MTAGLKCAPEIGPKVRINATRAALESVALQLLADHTEHCVAEAIRSGGGSEKVKELNEAVVRLVRS